MVISYENLLSDLGCERVNTCTVESNRMDTARVSDIFICIAAKITTRPGQIGVCNGYILEGEELETLFNTRDDLRLSSDKSPQEQ